jgi:alpha-beta hydrolase superfamily lysophospholipase
VFLHGVTSHGGWYYRSCHYLNTRGFEVHFLDRRGSGLNAAERGDVDCYETWIEDVAVYLEQLGGDRPVVLGGISWGGKLAATVARRHPGLVSGLALLCPGMYSYFEPNAVQRLALAVPVPKRALRRRVEIPLQPASLFTDAPRWREYVDHDPIALRDISLRFAREDRRMTRLARASASYLHMPLLMMLGGRDRIVANRRTRAFLSRTSAVHKTLIEYPNAAHTLEFEPDPLTYFADLAEWLGRTIVA